MNKKLIQGSMFMLLLFLIGACSDDKLEVGIEILPDSDQLAVRADSLPVKCFTYKGYPGNAYGGASGNPSFPIGEVFDPVFGRTTSNITYVFKYDSADYYGKDTILTSDEAVSLKLYLNTTDLKTHGDENGFDIEAYVLNNTIPANQPTNWEVPSDLYSFNYSHQTITTHNVWIDSINAPKRLEDSVITYIIDSGNYLVIEFDIAIAEALMDDIYTTGDYSSMFPAWLFKGVKNSANNGGLQSFNPDRGVSKMVLTYNRDTVGGVETRYSTFNPIGFHCNYQHNFEVSEPEISSVMRDSTVQTDKFYVGGLGSTRGVVRLEDLAAFKVYKNDSVGINLAELVLPIHPSSFDDIDKFSIPNRIKAAGLLVDRSFNLPDESYQYFGNEYFNGNLDTINWEYRINVTEIVSQFMLYDEIDMLVFDILNTEETIISSGNQFFLMPNYSNPERVILSSGDIGLDEKAYLRIIHTKVK